MSKKRLVKSKKGLEKITLFYILAGIFLSIALIGIIYWFTGFNFINLEPVEGTCKPIIENPGENKVEIVFFTDNVPESQVNEYVDFFINTPGPFKDNKDKVNFYYAGETDCEIVQGIAVYCYSKDLIRKSSICPNDYIIVLSDVERNIRSSTYINVVSLNIHNSKNVILHEFSHTFANLADEYVPADIPFGSKNCVNNCLKFEKYGDLEGCYEGCGKTTFFRSTENSIMRTLKTNDFGKLNTLLITGDMSEYE